MHATRRLAGARLAAAFIASSLVFALPAARAADPATINNGVLTAANGKTLYTFDKDADGKSMCNGKCAENWPPYTAPSGASPSGDFSLVTRDDGAKQYAYKGKPLYFWTKDEKPGDTKGDGVNSVWHVVK